MARHYDTRTGTFCSADPLAGSTEDPQSWNRYPYGRNDPIGNIDPSGQGFWSWLALAGSLVADYFTFGAANAAVDAEISSIAADSAVQAADLSALATGLDVSRATGGMPQGQNLQQQPQQPARTNCPPWQVGFTMPGPTQAHKPGGISNKPVGNGEAAIDPRDFGQDNFYKDAANYGKGVTPANAGEAAARDQMNQYVRDLRKAQI